MKLSFDAFVGNYLKILATNQANNASWGLSKKINSATRITQRFPGSVNNNKAYCLTHSQLGHIVGDAQQPQFDIYFF